MSLVLGVSGLYHDSAAALVANGEIVAAAQEERFTRRKHDARFPQRAIDYCLGCLGDRELAAVAYYEDPLLSFDRVFRNAVEMAPVGSDLWPEIARSQFRDKLPVADRLRALLRDGGEDATFFVDHHVSHAASAFYPSPFASAAILVVDAVGGWATTTIAAGEGASIELLRQIHYPHSLGLFYSAFTYHCGLAVNSDEYKLMGLAPYGRPVHADRIREFLIDLRADGSFRLDTAYFGFLDSGVSTNQRFAELFGLPRREPGAEISLAYMDLAASAQAVLEEALIGLARFALAETSCTRLCIAGGVGLNCVANGKLVRRLPELDDLWIQPAAGDAGGALGAALQVSHQRFGAPRHDGVRSGRDGQRGSFLGPRYRAAEVRTALEAAGVVFQHVESDEELNRRIAADLASGMIVGRCEGAMEFGPRALGNRSIIADARRRDGQAFINGKVKFRESWRPFAPAVLVEHVATYFDLALDSPYMLLVGEVKEEHRLPIDWSTFRQGAPDMLALLGQQRSALPAVTHVDYSARIQTVDRERNPRLHALMVEFHRQSSCPVLANTSFNVRGEPIVCTPQDAISCFLRTGIDILTIENFVAYKADQPKQLLLERLAAPQ